MSNNDYLDYLYHARSHKYIDRYFKNGKYVYVYKRNNSRNRNSTYNGKPIRILKDRPSFNVYKAMNGSINPYNKMIKYERINKNKANKQPKPIEIKKGTKLTAEQLNTFYRKQSMHTIGKPKDVDTYVMKDEYHTKEKLKTYGSMPSGLYVKKNKKGEYVVQ